LQLYLEGITNNLVILLNFRDYLMLLDTHSWF